MARTQFSEVFEGRATPIVAPLAKPAALPAPLPAAERVEHPETASSAMAAIAAVVMTCLRMVKSLSLWWRVMHGGGDAGEPRAGPVCACAALVRRGYQRTRRIGGAATRDLRRGVLGCPDHGVAAPHEEAGDRRASLALVPDVDADGNQKDHPLDDLHAGGTDAQQLQAAVQDRHGQT